NGGHVTIKNFKGLRALELEIPGVRSDKGAGCLMLLGENAAGKSSVLEALALTLVGSRAASRLARPEEVLRESGETRFGAANTNLTVQVDFFRGAESARLQMDPLEKRFVGDADPVTVVIGYGPRRYTDPKAGPWGDRVGDRVRGLFAPAFPLPDATEWLRGLWRNDRERYYAVARALRVILALRDDDELEPDEKMGFAVRAQGRLTPVHRMSEGYRSLFIMAVDIMRELLRYAPNLESARAVVLIDEIETHLHPRWKLRVMSSLRTAMPSVTFIATTHDPLCLRGMEDGEVVVLYKGDDQEVSKIDDLPSVRGMRAEQLLTSDYFGLDSTADPEIEDRLAEYVDALTLVGSGRLGATPDMAASLGHTLSESLVLGDTAADQVAQEALKHFLVERRKMPPPERSAARREVIERMLAVLRRPLGQ
ncbi:MAG TPA: hypothetical protein DGP25_02835, partial [Brevundimonas sp.]|nr:hypothetical protein [Brevundimonas sp.]